MVGRLLFVSIVGFMMCLTPLTSSAPNGIGSAGDEGCSCHGGDVGVPNNYSLDFTLDGLPNNYTTNTTYNITITMQNGSFEDQNANGFRMIASHGSIGVEMGDGNTHIMDGGATQTHDGMATNTWNLTWTSPATYDDSVNLSAYVMVGNNNSGGGGGTAGDYWVGKHYTVSPTVQVSNETVPDEGESEEESPGELPDLSFLGATTTLGVLLIAARRVQ